MKIATIGIDLAKLVFQVHAVGQRGKVMPLRQLRREQVAHYSKRSGLPPRLAAMPDHRAPVRDLHAWRAVRRSTGTDTR